MDGSYNSTKVRGELFRLSNREQALEKYPYLIYNLILRTVTVINDSSKSGQYCVQVKAFDGQSWILRVEDYKKCLKVVERFSAPLSFPWSPETILAQIESYIMVEF